MSGPGDCGNLRLVHGHWCGFCHTGRLFTRYECETATAPLCPACGSRDWREEDEVAYPGYLSPR